MEPVAIQQLWAGRILSGLAVAFLLFDVVGKLLRVTPVVDGTIQLGYPEKAVPTLGILLALGIVLYLVPQTTVIGAIYLSAYLGGAVATHFRVGNPLATHVLFPVYVALFLWVGLALRTPRLLSVLVGVRS